MLESIRQTVATRKRCSTEQAAWLWQHADDADLCALAGQVRARYHAPDKATFLIMAIVNYTNVCVARCDYCAFYRLPKHPETYLLSLEQVCARIDDLLALNGTLIGFNGGFHPKLKIAHYAELFRAVRQRFPDLDFYEMTVAEFMYSCKVSRITYAEGARILKEHGTRWVTGGGAEVLEDGWRKRHSPLKYTVDDYYAAQRAILEGGIGSTATMVIGFDESLDERLNHLERLRAFQDEVHGAMPSFLCWTYKPWNNALGGNEIKSIEYLRWLAVCRIYLDNFTHIRTSVLTQNENAMRGLNFGADDFDLPTEDEVTQMAGATISRAFDRILDAARSAGFEPILRAPFPIAGGIATQ